MKWPVKTTIAPKVRKPYAITVAWILSVVMLVMALLHLVRIDKLIPVIAETIGDIGSTWFVALIVIAEVFALPFLLRIPLSPLFRVKSGLLVVLVPLAWTCLSIWAAGNGHSIGEFSSYLHAPSNGWLILLNLAWLAASYWVLWLLGYDKAFAELKKTSKKHAKSV